MVEKPFSTRSGKYSCMNPGLLLEKQYLSNFIELYAAGFDRLRIPDLIGILQNGTVTGKLTHMGNIQDRLAYPLLLILIRGRYKTHNRPAENIYRHAVAAYL